ncbi:MAG: SGNH/GDSL hydrolase family protein [Moraxellaceae bacterium]|nr:SGNH/GDSL hydrolase family protein [Moraxellaceae bacterium]
MAYPFVTLILAPLLLWQGRQVRRITPRLPEAAGERDGRAGNGTPLRLLIAGDSAAAGVGAQHQHEALSGQLTAALAGRYTVHWQLVATTGHTLTDVMQTLEQMPAAAFDVVVTSIGVNDATAGTGLSPWITRHSRLLCLLQEKFGAQHVVLSAVPPMQHFPALPQPLRWYMGWRARRLNAALAAFAARNSNVTLVQAEFPLDAEFIASDGFHPAPAAYALWAAQLAKAIEQNRAH